MPGAGADGYGMSPPSAIAETGGPGTTSVTPHASSNGFAPMWAQVQRVEGNRTVGDPETIDAGPLIRNTTMWHAMTLLRNSTKPYGAPVAFAADMEFGRYLTPGGFLRNLGFASAMPPRFIEPATGWRWLVDHRWSEVVASILIGVPQHLWCGVDAVDARNRVRYWQADCTRSSAGTLMSGAAEAPLEAGDIAGQVGSALRWAAATATLAKVPPMARQPAFHTWGQRVVLRNLSFLLGESVDGPRLSLPRAVSYDAAGLTQEQARTLETGSTGTRPSNAALAVLAALIR